MAMQHSNGFLDSVKAVEDKVKHLTIQAFVDSDDTYTLIDVREDHEWQMGRLPHAEHLGKGIIERDMEKRFPDKHAYYVLYCGGGYRSTLAAYAIQQMGYENVWSLDGGFSGWKESGREIVT